MYRNLQLTTLALLIALTTQIASAGVLVPAAVGDPAIPDLVYDASTGEVSLLPDASSIIGYSLQNATNSFIPGNHTPILVGVTTALTSQVEEAALAPGSGSIGLVFPAGLDLAGLTSLLTVNTVSRSLGSPLVPFDLQVVNPPTTSGGADGVVPEPSTYAMSLLGIAALGLYSWRRRRQSN
ncbi:MAG: PEP-CTERM sorting domain-containing protein [Planctomycetota bacterium]|nr:MAG: PEP-CTERM sorting domain-containing protein [Planctomycetota bacterium]REK46613.1 MAG: PEP-CTERM sorting domain-containing protein [Planctomycetota bacterium]